MNKLLIFLMIPIISYCSRLSGGEKEPKVDFLQEQVYGSVSANDYLTGNYSEKDLVPYKNPGENRVFHLNEETRDAFRKLVQSFRTEHPEVKQIPIIISAFRSFDHQKRIWENKFTGRQRMRLPVEGKSPSEIIALILEYSSAPGTSRHHWGTDFDLNSLQNQYFEAGGKGEFLYKWLLQNASRFGFCQPYNEWQKRNKKGYREEKWHWSYVPVANRLQKEWVRKYKEKKLQFQDRYLGGKELGDLPLQYVDSVNSDCTPE